MISTNNSFKCFEDSETNASKTSELLQLEWQELRDDDMIEVVHHENSILQSRRISFKDLCHAIKVNLMMNGAIPFDGGD